MYINKKNKKHKGLAEIEMLLTIGVVGVILIVVVPIIMPFITDSKEARLEADFSAVYRSTYNGIAELRYNGRLNEDLEKLSFVDSSDVIFEEYFIYFQKTMPKLHTLDEPKEGDEDYTTWRIVFKKNGASYDTFIINGEYASRNGGTPFLRERIEK